MPFCESPVGKKHPTESSGALQQTEAKFSIVHGPPGGVQIGVSVAVAVLVGVSVAVAVFVCVSVGVSVAVAVFVGVSVGVAVLVGASVGVSVAVAVFVGVSVGVLVGCGVEKLRTIVGTDSDLPANRAVTTTGTSLAAFAAVTANERQPLPAGMTIDGGTGRTLGRLLFKVTLDPPAGAAPVRQTVTLPWPPPRITDWTDSDLNNGARTNTERATMHPPDEAVTVTARSLCTGCVDALNVYSIDPAGIVTVAGTVIAAFAELMATNAPPAGAGLARRTRIVIGRPPVVLPDPNR
jgi:hypothetical protein